MKPEYQIKKEFFAQTHLGLEEVCSEELKKLGATEVKPAYRGVYFKAEYKNLYRIVYCSRLSTRIYAPLMVFKCRDKNDLYKKAMDFEWEKILLQGRTFAAKASTAQNKLKNSHYAGLVLKDSIVDYYRKKYNQRPDIDINNPDVRLSLTINRDKAIISLDLSGESMHKRGYRQDSVKAPLIETLAAGLVDLAGWDGTTPLYDPMCGSGTILIEAALKATGMPSGYKKERFGFYNLQEFNLKEWEKIRARIDSEVKPLEKNLISGSDINPHTGSICSNNFYRTGIKGDINFKTADFKNLEGIRDSLIICNLPYGKRVDWGDNIEKFYKEFGDFLKQRCKGSTAWLLCGSKELTKKIGLKISRRIPLFNGPLEVRFVKIELY